MRVRIPGGYLVATKSCDPDYPGIDVEFIADEENEQAVSRPRSLFEYNRLTGELRNLVWADDMEEDYTTEAVFNYKV